MIYTAPESTNESGRITAHEPVYGTNYNEQICHCLSVTDRGVGDWGSCPWHQGRGTTEWRGKQK